MPEDLQTKVLRRAVEVAGGDTQRARIWFDEARLAEFGGLTAAQLVVNGRAQDILDLLDAMEAGSLG